MLVLYGILVLVLYGVMVVVLYGVMVVVLYGVMVVVLYGVMVLLPSIIPVPYMSSMESTCVQNTGTVWTIVHLFDNTHSNDNNRLSFFATKTSGNEV